MYAGMKRNREPSAWLENKNISATKRTVTPFQRFSATKRTVPPFHGKGIQDRMSK